MWNVIRLQLRCSTAQRVILNWKLNGRHRCMDATPFSGGRHAIFRWTPSYDSTLRLDLVRWWYMQLSSLNIANQRETVYSIWAFQVKIYSQTRRNRSKASLSSNFVTSVLPSNSRMRCGCNPDIRLQYCISMLSSYNQCAITDSLVEKHCKVQKDLATSNKYYFPN